MPRNGNESDGNKVVQRSYLQNDGPSLEMTIKFIDVFRGDFGQKW